MQWRDLPARARPYLAKATVALTAFVVLYEAYAHVASLVTMREYKLASYEVRLDSEQHLATFTAAGGGGLAHDVRGGALRVHGTSSAAAPAFVRFTGPDQHLDDVVATHVRFRTHTKGAYDVFVGLELVDGAQDGPGARRVIAVMRNGASDRFAIEGDVKTSGPRKIVHRASPVVPLAQPEAGASDAGSSTAGTSDAGAAEGEVHELVLRQAAYLHELTASFDGLPVAATESQWWMGSRVRLIFGVVAREAGVSVDVDLESAAFEQLPRPVALAPFTERFSGRMLDPRRWTVIVPDGVTGETSYDVNPARGLTLHARSRGFAGFQPGFVLLSPPTALASFNLKVRLDISALKGSAFVVGIAGSGYTPARFYDLGVKGTDDGGVDVLSVGHWSGDGQLGLKVLRRWAGREGTLALAYDATAGKIVASLDGVWIDERTLDLLPGDTVQLRIGANLQATDAMLDLAVREIAFDRPVLSAP